MALSTVTGTPLFSTSQSLSKNPLQYSNRLLTRAKRISSRTKKGLSTTTTREDSLKEQSPTSVEGTDSSLLGSVEDGYFLPELPGDKPDFWEGPQWDGFGFFVQYQWAFGIVFALIACGIAVATYNEGATDFKKTPAYQESIQSRDLLDEPEASNSDIFEGNPTEDAPSLE